MFKPELPKCTGCNETKKTKPGQWWYLSNYFGISGFFCPSCYSQVAHDPYGRPKNSKEYLLLKKKLDLTSST